jgi:hypothetical protein
MWRVVNYNILNISNVSTKPHVFRVHKNEGLLRIQSHRDDVLYILDCNFPRLFQCKIFPEEFLIISQLNDQWDIEGLL